jgi:DNA-binding MarR family transcriptional regulator
MKPPSVSKSFPETMALVCQLNAIWTNLETSTIRQVELSQAQVKFFNCIDKKSSVSGNDLAHKMGLSPSRASRVVDSLVQKKLVDRIEDKRDRRRCLITLSDQGQQIKEKINRTNHRWQRDLQKQLSTADLGKINSQLKKLIDLLQTL